MTKAEREEGKRLARQHQESEGETKARVARVRAKQGRGETLTREEAGLLGAQASVESTREEAREAKREGREEEFTKEHQVATWTTDPEKANPPHLGKDKEREVERLEAKKERGETLTRSEAGTLGGAARAKQQEE